MLLLSLGDNVLWCGCRSTYNGRHFICFVRQSYVICSEKSDYVQPESSWLLLHYCYDHIAIIIIIIIFLLIIIVLVWTSLWFINLKYTQPKIYFCRHSSISFAPAFCILWQNILFSICWSVRFYWKVFRGKLVGLFEYLFVYSICRQHFPLLDFRMTTHRPTNQLHLPTVADSPFFHFIIKSLFICHISHSPFASNIEVNFPAFINNLFTFNSIGYNDIKFILEHFLHRRRPCRRWCGW